MTVLSLAQYVQQYGAQAQQIQNATGVDGATLLAISYNEGGADSNTIAGGLYPGQYAFFGVKGSGGNAGSITIPSREVINGQSVMQTSTFNAYTNFYSAAQGFVQFLQNNSRYGTALQALANPAAFIQDLGNAGYATDPTWPQKIQTLRNSISTMMPSNDGSTQPPTGVTSTVDPGLASGAALVSGESASSSSTTATTASTPGVFTLVPGVSGPGFSWPGIKMSTGFLWSAGFFILAGLLIIAGLILAFRRQIEATVSTAARGVAAA